jgi:DNA polymerase-3 subunit beta
MDIIILKNNLKAGLDTVSRSIGSSMNLPILGNVLIRVTEEGIFLSTTNLELAITRKILGKVNEPGSITVPFATLSNIVGNSASERIQLQKKDNTLLIKTDNYEATLQGMDEGEFPIIPSVDQKNEYFEINAGVLKEHLQKVVIAAGISELRPEISGVFFIIEPSGCKLVATDSFRLAESSILGTQFKNTFSKGMRSIIPLKTAHEIMKVLDSDDTARIFIENNQILITGSDVSVISRLIDGNFPDYESIIPKTTDIKITVKREEVLNALKLLNAFSGKSQEIKMTISDKTITFYSSDNILGENTYVLPVVGSGGEVELVFNGRYLMDGVRSETSKEIYIGLNNENKPSVIKTPKNSDYFYIIMPIRQ